MRTFASLDEFVAAKGESLGFSEWHKITQEQVNAFADATEMLAKGKDQTDVGRMLTEHYGLTRGQMPS